MQEVNILDGLTDDELQQLYAVSHKKVYEKNQFIFQAGDILEHVFILLTGQIGVQEDQEDGNRNIMTIISKKMDCFGEVYLLLGKPLPLSAMAMKKSEVLMIPKFMVEKLPKLSSNLNTILAYKAFRLTQKMKIMMKDSLREKILAYLQQHPQVQLKRYELAHYLGVSRPALSKEIANMQDEKIIYIDESGFLLIN